MLKPKIEFIAYIYILLSIYKNFSKTYLKTFFFNQTPQHNHFCALNSLFNVVAIIRLGY